MLMHTNTGTCTDSKTTCIFFSSLKYVSWRLPQLWLKTWRHLHAHEHNIYVMQFEDFCPLHWSSHHSCPGTSWQTWKKKTHICLIGSLLTLSKTKKNYFDIFPWCFKLKQFLHTPSLGCMVSCRFSIFVHSLQISSALHHKVHNLSQTPLTRVMHGGLIKLILGIGVCTSLQQQVGNGPVST